MLLRDVMLFRSQIAVDLDDLHAVQKRSRDRLRRVGRRDEHHAAHIHRDLDIMIDKSAVLRAVQYLEKRRRRIALVVASELVHLIEKHQRVGCSRLDHSLDDASRKGCDIGSAVSADLRLIAHAAEADADILAVHGLRDALRDRGLAGSGRSYKAKDR